MQNKIIITIYIFAFIIVSIYSYFKPALNWDLVAYTGCVILYEQSDKNVIHQKTFQTIEETFGSKTNLLIEINDYSLRMWQDSEAFYQQLGFYKSRVVYLGLIYLLTKAGMPIPLSMQLVSIAFSFAIAIFSLFWLSKHIELKLAAPLTFLLINISGVIELSGIITPDAVSAFIFLLVIYLIYEHKKIFPALILCLLSIFVRPDNLIISIILAVSLLFTNIDKLKISKTFFLGFISLILLSYLLLNKFTASYGWWQVFTHTFIGKYYYPESELIDFSLYKILFAWIKGLYPFYSKSFFVFFLLLFLYSYRYKFKFDRLNLDHLFILLSLIFIIVHYLAFPLIQDRFFVPFYLIIGLIFLKEFLNVAKRSDC